VIACGHQVIADHLHEPGLPSGCIGGTQTLVLEKSSICASVRLMIAGPSLAWAKRTRRSSLTPGSVMQPGSSDPSSRGGPVPVSMAASIWRSA